MRRTRKKYFRKELMAVLLARELADGDDVQVGFALPVPEAAARLAHLLHGPNMNLIFLGAQMNVHHLEKIPLPEFSWDCRVVRWAESYSDKGHRFDRLKYWRKRVFFVGGIQVDRYGNTNLIGVGKDFKKLDFRGPGSIGTPTLTSNVGRYYIVINNHEKKCLVERCDYRSTVGWGDGDRLARKKLHLPGGGPQLCVTPLCVMDFEENTKMMRLKSIHPGVNLEDIIERTGFDLDAPNDTPLSIEPTNEELTTLRSRVDFNGILRVD